MHDQICKNHRIGSRFSKAFVPFILETAVEDGKVIQDFELESLTIGGEHSQKVKAPPIVSDYCSKNCVNLPSSTAVSRFIFPLLFFLLLFVSYSTLLMASVERITLQVISKLPHDLPAFTQGLAIEEDQLYESTGLYGQSSLRILNILTGEVVRRLSLHSNIFAEGIAVFPNQIVQITWKEKQAFVYEKSALKLQHTFFYSGEGWGLCRDGDTVWMSNGTSLLTQRDLKTFASLRTIRVHHNDDFLEHLNDLECVGNDLYANVWQKNWIIRINKTTGEVTGVIDTSSLLSHSEKEKLHFDHVLNGIAFRPKTNTFFLTGKEWPWIFEVRLIYESL